MRQHKLQPVLLGLGIAAVGAVLSDALARMTARALRDTGGPEAAGLPALPLPVVPGQA